MFLDNNLISLKVTVFPFEGGICVTEASTI